MNTATSHFDVSTKEGLIAYYDEAFNAAYRCAAKLTRGNRAAAEDLVQEGFLRLTKSARSGKVDAIGIGWIITTIRRIHIDRLRSSDREERRIRLVSTANRDRASMSAPTSTGDHLLAGLSEKEQTALLLRYVEGLSVGEIGRLIGISTPAAQSLLQRAKTKARGARTTQ